MKNIIYLPDPLNDQQQSRLNKIKEIKDYFVAKLNKNKYEENT